MDAGRMPLFDRLIDEEPYLRHEPTPRCTLDREGVIASVQHELEELLSARCPVPGDVALSRPRTVLDYGLPDLAWGARGLVPAQRQRVARMIQETVQAFEPRLSDVRVDIRDLGPHTGVIAAVIEAYLVMDEVREPISFSLPLGGSGGDGR